MSPVTAITGPTVVERVQAGAAWLDEHEPGWADRIDLDRLSLDDCYACVLGQLGPGGYEHARHERRLSYEATVALGFNMDQCNEAGGCSCDFAGLTEAWRELISARRAGESR